MRPIDADAFIAEMENRIKGTIKWMADAVAEGNEENRVRAEQTEFAFCEAALTAEKMPTIEAEPVKHGRWEFVGQLTNAPVYKCTVCKRLSYLKSDWCPLCGAKMDEENEVSHE